MQLSLQMEKKPTNPPGGEASKTQIIERRRKAKYRKARGRKLVVLASGDRDLAETLRPSNQGGRRTIEPLRLQGGGCLERQREEAAVLP
jgi:hypothetical protein